MYENENPISGNVVVFRRYNKLCSCHMNAVVVVLVLSNTKLNNESRIII